MKPDAESAPRATFAWLNATQFCGALNDNVFKLFVLFYLIRAYGEEGALGLSAVAMGLFVVPFLLFATAGGYLADRFSKRNVVVCVKVVEIAVMATGVAAFMVGSIPALCVVLFLMATQSALFGPSKFGIIPELVSPSELSRANSFLSAFSYLAIVLGSGAAPFLARWSGAHFALAASVCVVVAVVGFLCSLRVARTPPAMTMKRLSPFVVPDVWRTLKSIRSDRFLLIAVVASAYFLLIGAFIQINLVPYGMEALHLDEIGSGYLFLVAAIGIGLGALWSGRLSGKNVEFGVVPFGAFGLTANAFLLAVCPASLPVALVLIFLTGVSVGVFVVPLNAFIQLRAPRERIGEILAASGFLSWVGVLLAAVFVHIAGTLGMSARQGFVVIGCLTLVLTVFTIKVLPDFLVRFIGVMVARLFYRARPLRLEHYPVHGPALLVSNHVSYIDAFIVGMLRPRRVRFIMNRDMYEISWLTPILRLLGVIPISFHDSPKKIIEAFREARRALDDGYVVCIFAEGAITRTGLPREFKAGFERIVKGTDYPVVPLYLGGLWGSIFSYSHGVIKPRWPQKFPYPVTVVFGEPLPATSSADEVRRAVMELSCDYYEGRKATREPIGAVFVRTARRNWGRRAMSDATGRVLTYGQALTGAVALASAIEKRTGGQDKLGVLLPPTVGGSLTNLATTLLRKVPVNLNYTASREAVLSAGRQCDLRTTITSRAFLDRMGELPIPGEPLFIEDLLAGITPLARLRAWLAARCAPCGLLSRSRSFHADELLTVIFSSGSTGDPKGVMLSHHNVASNIEALRMVLRVSSEDNICAVLPFFHSFGYTGTVWFPLLSGFGVSYYPNPVDGAGVAKTVEENHCTLLLSTPTFLMAYVRRAKPEQFASLRLVVAGAEKLKVRIADAFEKRFGVRPLEGYGATELAPVGALNIPDVTMGEVHQAGMREGSVGHPLPGVAAKIVDPDTGEELANDTPGLLLVKGPNVMLGYLNNPGATEEVLQDGWYSTGDIAMMSADGFITITDRLSRFSKIGGEMVPHLAVEEAYHAALGKAQQVLAVASVPDEKKGERLVVLYTGDAGTPEQLHELLGKTDLPNLWKPGRNAYVRIEEVPILGTGKLDLKKLKELAAQATEA